MIFLKNVLLKEEKIKIEQKINIYNKRVKKAVNIVEKYYADNRKDIKEGNLDISGILVRDGRHGKIFICVLIRGFSNYFRIEVINKGNVLFGKDYQELPQKKELIADLEKEFLVK